MAVITISRQMGSLGNMVAEEIARCLNYQLVWREVINEAARRAGVPEVALATIDELDLLGLRPTAEDMDAYHAAVHEIMQEIYQKNNAVIVGRAGQVILRGEANALHVRVFAPFELRAARIAERHSVSLENARKQIKVSDQNRTRYLKRFYNARWDDAELYDVLVNTEHITPAIAARVVCKALETVGVKASVT